jgi:aminoglycoside phosphotransferase (APT) family kinase protein
LFYRNFAKDLPGWVPKCYGIWEDEEGVPSIVLEEVEARPTTLNQPCTFAQAALVLTSCAKMHAKWWKQSAALAQLPGYESPEKTVLKPRLSAYLADFKSEWTHLPSQLMQLVVDLPDRLEGDFQKLWADAPITLIHFDVRLGNILFADANELFLVDWQTLSRGPAAFDVAYFFASSLDSGLYEQRGQELLKLYHDRLRDCGVSNYGWEKFLRDVYLAAGPALSMALVACCSSAALVNKEGADGLRAWVTRAVNAYALTCGQSSGRRSWRAD